MFHIKNIWDKIYFHPLFYFIVGISFITGHFRNIIYFTVLILIHELGHTVMAVILGFKLKRIEIYPFGGLSKLEYDINIKKLFELLILLFGPIVQIIFTFLVFTFKADVSFCFYTYSMYILVFNLLPIYPLDGGRLINIILSFFFTFYKSLKITYYISYFILISMIILYFLYFRNFIILIVLISLILEFYKSYRNRYSNSICSLYRDYLDKDY